jgi:hypothetical protein
MSAPISTMLTKMDVGLLATQQDAKDEITKSEARSALAECGIPDGLINLETLEARNKLGRYAAPRLVNNVLVSATVFAAYLEKSMKMQMDDMEALSSSEPDSPESAALKGKSISLAGQVMNQTASAWSQVTMVALKATEIGGVRSKRKGQRSAGPEITFEAENVQINNTNASGGNPADVSPA